MSKNKFLKFDGEYKTKFFAKSDREFCIKNFDFKHTNDLVISLMFNDEPNFFAHV